MANNIPDGYEPIESSTVFGKRNGPIFEKLTDNDWVRAFRAEEKHSNSVGVVHGGMLMTFADIVLARAVMDHVAPPFVTLRLLSDFVSPALTGAWVEGRAQVNSVKGDIIFVEGEITSRTKVILKVSGQFKALRRT